MEKESGQTALRRPQHDTNGDSRRDASQRTNEGSRNDVGRTLETVLNAIPDVIGIQDPHHRIIRYNVAGYQFLNKTPEEVVGKKCFELMGRDEPCDICATAEVHRTKRPARKEEYVESMGVWLDVRSYPILDENGEIISVVEHLRNITNEQEAAKELSTLNATLNERVKERTTKLKKANQKLREEIERRKRVETMLAKSEVKYATAFRSSPVAIAISTLKEGRYIDVNDSFLGMYSYEREEVVGHTSTELKLWAKSEERSSFVRLLQENGEVHEFECQFMRKTGEIGVQVLSSELIDLEGDECILTISSDVTERRRAEAELIRLSKAIEGSSNAVGISDATGNSVYHNRAFVKLTGYTTAQLNDAGGPATLYADRTIGKKVLETTRRGASWSGEAEIVTRDGQVVINEIRTDAVKNEEGKIVGLIGIHTDIRKRKESEHALRESEARFRELFDSISSGVAVYETKDQGKTFKIKDINKAGIILSRVKKEQVVGRNALEVFPNIDKTGLLDLLRQVWLDGTPRTQPTTLYQDDRLSHWTENHVYRLPSGEVVALYDDVTYRMLAQIQLEERETQYRTIFNSSVDPLLVVNLAGDIVRVSPRACETYGYTYEELIMLSGRDLISPEARHSFDGFLDEVKTEGTSYAESLHITKDGTFINAEVRGSLLPYKGEKHILVIIRDVTARKKAERELMKEAAFVRNDPAPVLQTRYNGDVMRMNAAAEKLLGNRLRTQSIKEVLPEFSKTALDGAEDGNPFQIVQEIGEGTFLFTLSKDALTNSVYIYGSDITKQKLAEEEVKASEKKYKTLFDSSQDAIVLASPEEGFLSGNPAAIRMFGCRDEEEFVSRSPAELSSEYQPDGALSSTKSERAMRKALRGGSQSVEWTHKRVDGTEFLASVLLNKTELNGKNVLQATIRDITEQRKVQEALKDQEERFRTLFEKSRDAILITAKDGRHLDANQAALNLFGYSREEMMALNSRERYAYPEDRERVTEIIGRDGSYRDYELQYRKKDGSIMECLATSTLRQADDGEVLEYQTSIRDITEQKRAEKALKESEAFNFALFEHNPIETIVVDQEGTVVKLNRALRESNRIPPEVGDVMYKDYAAKHVVDMHAELRNCITSNTTRSFASLPYGDRYLNIHISPFFGGGIITSQDITQEKRAEETLRKSEERFRLIIEENADGIVIVDAEGTVRFVNKSAEALWGRTSAVLVGTPFGFPLVSEETTEISLFNQDRGIVPAEMRVVRIKMEEGISYLASLRDITERKRAEDDLRNSEKKYRALFENSRDPIVITTKKGAFVDVNEAMLELFEYTRQELENIPIREMVGDVAALKTLTHKTDEKTHVKDFELDYRKKDGTVLNCLTSATVRRDDNGSIIGYEGVIRDITAEKRNQEELKQTLDRLRKALTSTVEAMALTVETRDPYTAGHQRRVAGLASAIAKEMGLSGDTIEGIEMAGTIHDLGKIAVPAEILSKPGRITDIEFSLIKTHARVGHSILMNIAFPWPVADIVIQHHERIDGTGYPQGIKGEEILLEAKIIGVADVVEAMATHRPYRPALGTDTALDEITKRRGSFFDSDVVDACVRLFKEKGFELES